MANADATGAGASLPEAPFSSPDYPLVELSHSQVRDRLSDYVDGLLPEQKRHQIHRHLEHCDDCRAILGTLKKTIGLTRDLGIPPAPRSAKQRLLDSLPRARSG